MTATAWVVLAHAFATVAIGGFSHYDASIGHFDSRAIELVANAPERNYLLRRLAETEG